jgi:hypothetical protein
MIETICALLVVLLIAAAVKFEMDGNGEAQSILCFSVCALFVVVIGINAA